MAKRPKTVKRSYRRRIQHGCVGGFGSGAPLFSGLLKPEGPFDAPFAADGDMATVTWSNLPERLKGRKRGVNCPADA